MNALGHEQGTRDRHGEGFSWCRLRDTSLSRENLDEFEVVAAPHRDIGGAPPLSILGACIGATTYTFRATRLASYDDHEVQRWAGGGVSRTLTHAIDCPRA